MNQKLASGLEPFNEKSDRLLMKKKMYQMVLSWQAPRHVNSVANVLSLEYGEFLEICFKRGCGWSLIFNKKNNVSTHFCCFATNLGSFRPFIIEGRNTPTYYLLRTELGVPKYRFFSQYRNSVFYSIQTSIPELIPEFRFY